MSVVVALGLVMVLADVAVGWGAGPVMVLADVAVGWGRRLRV